MGKDKRRDSRDDDNDSERLKTLAKYLRGIKPPQRNKFHERKPKREKSLKDVANDYNRDGDLEDVE